ncbi:glycosyltransferase family A protein [Winogradskyella sp.]|uniref:glycosyltransferase family 2 protein n=1 Tax=Winogradskyella sp. TaxID=1883156 RepID=UPI002619157B|nr:glycosyltransferase family A protein [Winogradskyella sp.]
MNTKIKVSVVTPVYNAEKLLKRCLDSIFSQDFDGEIEVLAIDDGSTDSSLKILREYPKNIKIYEQANKGPAAARNIGIKNATGKFLAFLDADDYWLPEFLSTTISYLELKTSIIAVNVGQIHKIPGKKDVVLPNYLSQANHDTSPFVLENFFGFWYVHKHICTGSVVFKTEVVKNAGGQLTSFRVSQDLEYWSYLGTLGKWGFIPKILFVSDGGQVTKDRGWLSKNLIRWNNTPGIEEFEKRSLANLNDAEKLDFNKVVGWVSYNFTYNHIMAGNYKKARHLILNKIDNFPKSKLSSIYGAFARLGIVPFTIFAALLRYFQISRQQILNLK